MSQKLKKKRLSHDVAVGVLSEPMLVLKQQIVLGSQQRIDQHIRGKYEGTEALLEE